MTTAKTLASASGSIASAGGVKVPFYFGEETITAATCGGSDCLALIQKGTNEIIIGFGSAGSKGTVVITLSNEETYTITALTIT